MQQQPTYAPPGPLYYGQSPAAQSNAFRSRTYNHPHTGGLGPHAHPPGGQAPPAYYPTPPVVVEQKREVRNTSTVRNLVNLKKPTLTACCLEGKPHLWKVSFTFDATAPCLYAPPLFNASFPSVPFSALFVQQHTQQAWRLPVVILFSKQNKTFLGYYRAALVAYLVIFLVWKLDESETYHVLLAMSLPELLRRVCTSTYTMDVVNDVCMLCSVFDSPLIMRIATCCVLSLKMHSLTYDLRAVSVYSLWQQRFKRLNQRCLLSQKVACS